jgi:hypothetical protein
MQASIAKEATRESHQCAALRGEARTIMRILTARVFFRWHAITRPLLSPRGASFRRSSSTSPNEPTIGERRVVPTWRPRCHLAEVAGARAFFWSDRMSVGAKRARKSKPTANQAARRSTCFARPTLHCGSVSLNVLGGRPSTGVFSQAAVGEVCGIHWPSTGGQFVYSDGVDGPTHGHRCARMWLSETTNRGPVHDED